MRKYTLIGFFLLTCTARFYAQPHINLDLFASGISDPVDVVNAGDDRLFAVERTGRIRIIDADGTVHPEYFLDIHSLVLSSYDEQGLLGLAFHPDYATNGEFFVFYTDKPNGNEVVAKFLVSATNPDSADASSEEILFSDVDPYWNHNGGNIMFGPDGYLYFGIGDGGSGGDPGNRAQDPMEKFGKIHRIDVDGGDPYAIPDDNPFKGSADTLETIWDLGLRNPWRWSFDRLTGDLWIGDVGQNLHEEVDFEPAGTGGVNYGWRCYEGFSEYDATGCSGSYTEPILDYPHSFATGGYAITGGYVYRGSEFPGMYGYYMYCDYVSGNWWTVYPDGAGGWDVTAISLSHDNIASFGQDINGELYCADRVTGNIYHIIDECGSFSISETATDYVCGVSDGAIDMTITDGTAPYSIDWSTGASTEDLSGLDTGIYIVTVIDDNNCSATDTVAIISMDPFTPTITVSGTDLIASDGVSWQWYIGGAEITDGTEQTYTPTVSGNYTVLVTDANGCSVMSDTIYFTFNAILLPPSFHSITLFPNPATDEVILDVQSENAIGKISVIVTDATGRIMIRNDMQPGFNDHAIIIPVHDLPAGMYKISLSNEELLWMDSFLVIR